MTNLETLQTLEIIKATPGTEPILDPRKDIDTPISRHVVDPLAPKGLDNKPQKPTEKQGV